MKEQVIASIAENRVIAILRGVPAEKLPHVAKALYDGGIRLLEITFSADGSVPDEETARRIALLVQQFGDKMHIGAGTVLTPQQVRAVKAAGGSFVISPDSDEEVIRETAALGLVSIPGALTPSEVTRAVRWGADFVKLLPVGCMGTEYIKAVRAPLNHVDLLAVGGVNDSNMIDYLDAGCCGVGMGGSLVNRKLIDANEFDKITTYAKTVVGKIEKWGNDR